MNKKEILGLCEFLKLHGYENTDNISKFIFGLQQENKKYKEVIDKATNYIEKESSFLSDDEYELFNKKELLDILKEAQNER